MVVVCLFNRLLEDERVNGSSLIGLFNAVFFSSTRTLVHIVYLQPDV